MHRTLRVAVAFLATVLAAALPGAARAASFYDPPSPLPSTQPGTLLRSEPVQFRGLSRPPEGTIGWRIMYVSQTALGAPVAVTGTLLLPNDERRARPLVSLAPGSHGLGDKCAASRLITVGVEAELDNIRRLLADGDAVVMTDYEGLGTPGMHPFAVNVAAGRNVLDALRAARQVPGTGLAPDGQLGIYGYSQGGGAAGSAAEQQPTYAPELKITAAVVGGVLGEPARLPNALFGNFWAGVALFAVLGYDSAYPDLKLNTYLSRFGRGVFNSLSRTCMESGFPLQFAQLTWFMKGRSPIRTAAWQARLKENTLGYRTPQIPIYQFHGQFDQVLNYGSAKRVRARWCAGGADVRFVTVPLAEHFLGMLGGLDGAARWLAGRFAGNTAHGNCPTT